MHALAPFLVPIFAIMIPIVALIAKAVTDISAHRSRAEQRRDMLARGIPLDQIEGALAASTHKAADSRRASNPQRTAAAIRMTAILCIFSGLSMAVFFVVLALILHTSQVMTGAAVGILPFGVGLGFLVDYRARRRELARIGDPALESTRDPEPGSAHASGQYLKL